MWEARKSFSKTWVRRGCRDSPQFLTKKKTVGWENDTRKRLKSNHNKNAKDVSVMEMNRVNKGNSNAKRKLEQKKKQSS